MAVAFWFDLQQPVLGGHHNPGVGRARRRSGFVAFYRQRFTLPPRTNASFLIKPNTPGIVGGFPFPD
jgi:hypothetical protein